MKQPITILTEDSARDSYERLWAKINGFGMNPVQRAIFEEIMTPEDAELAAKLSMSDHESAAAIAKRLGERLEELEPKLDDLAMRGIIFKNFNKDPKLYHLVPWAPGLAEFQISAVKNSTKLAALFDAICESGEEVSRALDPPWFRVIPVGESVAAEVRVLPYEQVDAIIDKSRSIAVTDCMCRAVKKALGQGCDAPIEDMCFYLDDHADFFANTGKGRLVSKEEAKQILRKSEDAGLIHQVCNAQDVDPLICNCCNCCCQPIRTITKLKISHASARSNFIPEISDDRCTGCGSCADGCPLGALKLKDGVVVLLTESCIGCGVCTTFCSHDAIKLQRRSEDEQIIPPKTMPELFERMGASLCKKAMES